MDILRPKLYSVDRHLLAAEIYVPAGTGSFPAVILLPGFLEHKDQSGITACARYFAENGIAAIRFDTTGMGESQGVIAEDYSLSNYTNDLDIIITHLSHQTFIKTDSIALWGHGMGGVVGICYAAEYPSRVRAVIAVSTPDSMAGDIWEEKDIKRWKREKQRAFALGKGTVSIPHTFILDARMYNCLDCGKVLKCPLLSIVGTKDATVPLTLSRRWYDAVEGAKKWHEIPDMTHSYESSAETASEVSRISLTFLKSSFGMYRGVGFTSR